MHEIDDGNGWKHTDGASQQASIVRSRVFVLKTIITVGNCEYIFMWHFDQAAALHYRIQATGIFSTAPIAPGASVPWGKNVYMPGAWTGQDWVPLAEQGIRVRLDGLGNHGLKQWTAGSRSCL
ncbi:copper amine oxidase [Thelonectria olida]|uniref:Amine oxidase n=1 Tax=Thelonectria olida TaxID=1576542 RepID=A0A9P9APY6_9HYPO|nr:copper amine oxidase [Thelonectria olida]